MEHIVFGTASAQMFFDAEKGYLEQIQYNGKIIPLHSKLWTLQTADGELGIADMESFSCQTYDSTIKLCWQSPAASVAVTVSRDSDDKLRTNLSADLVSGVLRRVQFPILEGMNFRNDNYLLIAYQNGHLMKNPVDVFLSKEVEVPFWMGAGVGAFTSNYPAGTSFQFSTFYAPGELGYYFATEDPDAYLKTYTYQYNKERHALDYIVTNYPENMGKTRSYCMPYDFVLKLYDGDWQDAAQTYRSWAIRQKWCKEKLSQRKLPEKLVKTDLWRINHMDYALGTRTGEYLETSKAIRDAVDGNLALHWYGWNMGRHDQDYPEYISDAKKAEGWPEMLRQWNQRFDKEGITKIPYVNARLWESRLKSWKTAAPSAIKDETGNTLKEPWCEDLGFDLRPVCPATALWQNTVADFCREYGAEPGFDGMYLDQIGSFNAVPCFDESHPHPIGGGTWWNDSYHAMLKKVRQVLGEDSIITTESCCETYVDFFDLFLILDTCFQHTGWNYLTGGGDTVSVPLFSMIYGDYALSYGSACQFIDRTDRFEYKFIRNLIWGILPCVEGGNAAELESSTAGEKLAVLKRAVAFYKENKDIILYGRLCRIPEYTCRTIQLDWEIDEVGTFVDTIPAVCASIWEDKDGKKHLLAYNFSNSEAVMVWNSQNIAVAGKQFVSIPFL